MFYSKRLCWLLCFVSCLGLHNTIAALAQSDQMEWHTVSTPSHHHDGYTYEKPKVRFNLPPAAVEIGSRMGAVSRIKLSGYHYGVPSKDLCNQNNLTLVVEERSKRRPNSRRLMIQPNAHN